MKKASKISIAAGVVAAVALVGIVGWQFRHDLIREVERSQLPEAQEYTSPDETAVSQTEPVITNIRSPVTSPTANPDPVPKTAENGVLPAEINLAVPFTPQAPNANWELPFKEFCEEASVLMAIRYLQNQPITGPEDATQAMLAIQDFEEKTFGYYMDTDAADTAKIITDHFDYPNVELMENPTTLQIKQALAAKKPVIMPAAGRMLGNPYFQQPGPLYHMLVIKGYTADGRFIVNDPGTRRGADFIYSEEAIMNAMHDWRTDEQIELGKKVVIIVG